jgi:hypothetical protein
VIAFWAQIDRTLGARVAEGLRGSERRTSSRVVSRTTSASRRSPKA